MVDYVDGKRYRVTRDYGELTYRKPNFPGGLGLFAHPVTGAIVGNSEGVTAELITDPLPTTPGSVVQIPASWRTYTAFLTDRGWRDDTGSELRVETIHRFGWTLIYDAGAQQS